MRHVFRVAGSLATFLLVHLVAAADLSAEGPEVHYSQHGVEMPPGAIGGQQLLRGGPLPGYFQPVEIRAPEGARISLAVEGDFSDSLPAPLTVGMLIAPVYRLRVTDIPLHPGEEVFPTVEVINRLYPPAGQVRRFPVPIELTREDLELALDGHYITRVVYLEDPRNALPFAEDRGGSNWFDAGPGANPLETADRMGRPMAIVRIGGRLPNLDEGPDLEFLGGCPPFLALPEPGLPVETADESQSGDWLSRLFQRETQ